MDTLPVNQGRKYEKVLQGARDVFLRDGFEGASVDEIARRSGVSKATLYSYFPDKRRMFIEVFRAELQTLDDTRGCPVPFADLSAEALPSMFRHLAISLARKIIHGTFVSSYRLGVAEAGRFPALAQELYDVVRGSCRQQIAMHLAQCIDSGLICIPDMELAVEQFVSLCGTILHERTLLLGSEAVAESDVARVADGAAAMFLSHYRAPVVAV